MMKLLSNVLCIIYMMIALPAASQKKLSLASPNGNILFSFRLVNKAMEYSVAFKQKTIVDYSSLGLLFNDNNFNTSLRINKPVFRDTTEDYELVTGKTKLVHTHYKEVRVPLEETAMPFRKINLLVRVFDDGLAFRYEIQQQKNFTSFTLLDENTTFKLTGNPQVHTLFLPNYTSSHEGEYSSLPLSDVKPDTLMDMPALFEFPGNIYLAITEAALLDYAGMYLSKHDDVLVSKLSPLPKQAAIKVKAYCHIKAHGVYC